MSPFLFPGKKRKISHKASIQRTRAINVHELKGNEKRKRERGGKRKEEKGKRKEEKGKKKKKEERRKKKEEKKTEKKKNKNKSIVQIGDT